MSRKLRPPAGIYITTDDWKNSIIGNQGNNYIDLRIAETFLTLQPKSIYEKIHWSFIDESKQVSQSAFLAVLNNARVCRDSIITEDNHLLFDLSYEYLKKTEKHSIFHKRALPRLRKYSGEVAALTFSVVNYYHWLFDILVRFYLLELGNIQYDKIIISNQHNFKYQRETLDLFGVEYSKLFTCHKNFHLEANKIIVPSLVGYYGRMPKWACNYLRNKFLRYSSKVVGYERLFISREKAGQRNIVNEEQVLGVLKKYGFRKVILEELPVLEQINLFASAEAVVAPHGAGLANLVFCKPDTKVIELFSPNYVNVMYWRLCNHVELDYYYVIGEGESAPDYVDVSIKQENMDIDVRQLTDTLSLANL